MARKATAANADLPPIGGGANVDYSKALEILEMIDGQKAESREANGELSVLWKRIEDEIGLNKSAAKVFNDKIKKAPEDKRGDFLRTMFGLMKAEGIHHPFDLMDAADGKKDPKSNVTPMPGLSAQPQN